MAEEFVMTPEMIEKMNKGPGLENIDFSGEGLKKYVGDKGQINAKIEEETQRIIDQIAKAQEYREQEGEKAQVNLDKSIADATEKAALLSKQYGIDIKDLVASATKQINAGITLGQADLEKAIKGRAEEMAEVITGVKTATDATIQERKAAEARIVGERTAATEGTIQKMEGEVATLRGEQKATYGAAEQEQKDRAASQEKVQQQYMQDVQAQRAGMGQEAPLAELQKAAMGQVPSAAELMLKNNLQQNTQRIASAASARGYSPAAQRAAIMGGQQAAMSATGQAASLRADEMANARNTWTQAYQARQAQLQQAQQYGMQFGLSVQDMFNQATATKLAGAQIDKDLQANAIAQKLGLRTQSAQDIMAQRSAAAADVMGLNQQAMNQTTALRGENLATTFNARQANIAGNRASTENMALQGLAARGQAAQFGAGTQADMAARALSAQQALNAQRLGISADAASQGVQTQAALGSQAMGMEQDYWKSVSANQTQRDISAAALQQQQALADQDFWTKIVSGGIAAAGTVGAASLSMPAKAAVAGAAALK